MAITLRLQRNGAVGFIDWLGLVDVLINSDDPLSCSFNRKMLVNTPCARTPNREEAATVPATIAVAAVLNVNTVGADCL